MPSKLDLLLANIHSALIHPIFFSYEVETFATSVNRTDLHWQYTAFKLSCRLTDLHPTQSKGESMRCLN
jgi:hypothetical protein